MPGAGARTQHATGRGAPGSVPQPWRARWCPHGLGTDMEMLCLCDLPVKVVLWLSLFADGETEARGSAITFP